MLVRVVKQSMSPAQIIKPLMWMLMAFYLGYHTLHGERGLYALVREQRELAHLQSDYATTKNDRERMELRVSHLRDESIDRDLLDEQMRRMLGVMQKDEVMLLTGNGA